MFILGYFVPVIYALAVPLAIILLLVALTDCWLLYKGKRSVEAFRVCNERFSNGDENEVRIEARNLLPFKIKAGIIDELPYQFQRRDFKITTDFHPGEEKTITYSLRPVTRGVYSFGNINILVTTAIGLICRRVVIKASSDIKVYPSFIKLHKYELMAISQQLHMQGEKKIRKIGNSQEFDTIRDYVRGDDPRHINWAATARRGHIMTNHYIDERSQNIYCVIDKSRSMKMPFEGMTLLDYSINASLIISDVALRKGDKAGLLTFEDKPDVLIPASNRNAQIHQLMEGLYGQKTTFREPDFGGLYSHIRNHLNQRSLLLMFTNFESIHSLMRQLTYLQLINRQHLLLVIYFKNTEVDVLLKEDAKNTREIYDQAIAQQMLNEKELIREELAKAGILSLYTAPKNLNVDVINKYIEIKAKRAL